MAAEKSAQRARPVAALAALCLGAVALAGCGSSSPTTPATGYNQTMIAAAEAANRIAVDLTTFDYRSLDAFYATMQKNGTASFNQNLQATRADVTAYDKRLQVISSGSVIDSAAKPVAPDGTVTVLLFVDERLRSVGGKVGLLEQVRVKMVMKQVNGAWLVDQATVTGASS